MARISSDTTPMTLAADVGGTNARIALVGASSANAGTLTARNMKTYRCADYPGLGTIIQDYLENMALPANICAASIAIAGQLADGVVTGSRLAWKVQESELTKVIGQIPLYFVNDFYAAALGSQYTSISNAAELNRGKTKSGTVIVLGPGTGFGAAAILKRNGQTHVLRTEAGQMTFAPTTTAERALVESAIAHDSPPRNETFLSGGGLELICRLLHPIENRSKETRSAAEICRDAIQQSDQYAERAVQMFWEILASVVRNLSLAYYAEGGVLFAGGVVNHLMPTFQQQRFLSRFTDDEIMHDFLNDVPIHVLDSAEIPVVGAAASIASQGLFDRAKTNRSNADRQLRQELSDPNP